MLAESLRWSSFATVPEARRSTMSGCTDRAVQMNLQAENLILNVGFVTKRLYQYLHAAANFLMSLTEPRFRGEREVQKCVQVKTQTNLVFCPAGFSSFFDSVGAAVAASSLADSASVSVLLLPVFFVSIATDRCQSKISQIPVPVI